MAKRARQLPRVRIFSTDTDSGSVTVAEPVADGYRVVAQIPVGNAPRGAVKFTSDGRGFVSNCGGDTISEIDVLTNRETSRITVGPAPRGIGIIPGDRFALVSSSGANFVSVVDLTRREEIDRVAVGRDPRHMAVRADGTAAYVAIWGSHYVARLDTLSLANGRAGLETRGVREVARIEVGDGAHPYSLSIDRDGKRAYVANTQAEYVTIIDLDTDRVAGTVNVGSKGSRAVAFSADGRHAFVSVEDVSQVVAIDTTTLEVVAHWPVGPGPRGLAVDPSGRVMFTCSFSRSEPGATGGFRFTPNTLTVLDLASVASVERDAPAYAEIAVGKGPCSVAVLDLRGLTALHALAGG